MKKKTACILFFVMVMAFILPGSVWAAKREKKEPEFKPQVFEHHYQLQPDSYEATDTENGYRHYICADCGDEYEYYTDPLVYTVNPKTGEPVTQKGAFNPVLPSWEHIPDGEPQVFWSKSDKEWRVYLYGSHDDTGIGYCGMNYRLYSAPVYDLSDWRFDGVYLDISEHATSGATVGLFAPDCAYDVTTDMYYMISNEFNAYSVLRAADNPAGPWNEEEALWKISVKAAYDPSIYIENGTIYIAGSSMKTYYNTFPEVEQMVAEDGYSSGMSHIGVLFRLKENLADGDGIEAVSWLPNDARNYLPIYEGPSLTGYVEELGVYVYLYVSYDVDSDGTWYNSSIGWLWTDDLMNGTWHFGENNVEEEYSDPGYVISGNHGNIVSDTSGRYIRDLDSGRMIFTEFPTYAHGNNHGGMAKINGSWYFFGHRQTNGHTNSRQAVAGELKVYKDGDTPVIEPMEFTSSGIAGSISAFETIPADRACVLIEAADHQAPSMEKNNVHSDCVDNTPYIKATRDETATHATYICNLKNGNVTGFKYLDFGEENIQLTASLLLTAGEDPGSAGAEIWFDAPTETSGGTKLGTIPFDTDTLVNAERQETGSDGTVWSWVSNEMDAPVSGVHAVYIVFVSDSENTICGFDQFQFMK